MTDFSVNVWDKEHVGILYLEWELSDTKLYHKQEVPRLRLCEMKVLKYYVENKAQCET